LREKLDGRAEAGAIRAGMEDLKRIASEVAAAAYQGATQTDTSGETADKGDYIQYDKEDKE